MSYRRWILLGLHDACNRRNHKDEADNGEADHGWDLGDFIPNLMEVCKNQLDTDEHEND